MSLSAEEIRELVLECPAITIAMYSGDYQNGTLTILAKGGKIAENEEDFCPVAGGNVVDGPALEWLGTQAMPRIWVSDGIVTGTDDRASANLFAEAIALMMEHTIWRIPYLHNAATVVKTFNDPRKRRLALEAMYA